MKEKEKYQRVRDCETLEELSKAIIDISKNDLIEGKTRSFSASDMAYVAVNFADFVKKNQANRLTRNYGIRQQGLYILYMSNMLGIDKTFLSEDIALVKLGVIVLPTYEDDVKVLIVGHDVYVRNSTLGTLESRTNDVELSLNSEELLSYFKSLIN